MDTKEVIITGLDSTLVGRLREAFFVQTKDGKDLVTKRGSRIAKYVVVTNNGDWHYITRWVERDDFELPTIVEGQEPLVKVEVDWRKRNFGDAERKRYGYEPFTEHVAIISVPEGVEVI